MATKRITVVWGSFQPKIFARSNEEIYQGRITNYNVLIMSIITVNLTTLQSLGMQIVLYHIIGCLCLEWSMSPSYNRLRITWGISRWLLLNKVNLQVYIEFIHSAWFVEGLGVLPLVPLNPQVFIDSPLVPSKWLKNTSLTPPPHLVLPQIEYCLFITLTQHE